LHHWWRFEGLAGGFEGLVERWCVSAGLGLVDGGEAAPEGLVCLRQALLAGSDEIDVVVGDEVGCAWARSAYEAVGACRCRSRC
jgi:hypothetical protein